MINTWSHSTLAAKPTFPGPGAWLQGGNQRLMEHIARRNPQAVLAIDFCACNAYDRGHQAAAQVRCPVLFVLGRRDQMTPARAAEPLAQALEAAGVVVRTVLLDGGHALMAERPDETLDALFGFARSTLPPAA
jgi:pimeloyl-ACP methyl ester carboxylesterase